MNKLTVDLYLQLYLQYTLESDSHYILTATKPEDRQLSTENKRTLLKIIQDQTNTTPGQPDKYEYLYEHKNFSPMELLVIGMH